MMYKLRKISFFNHQKKTLSCEILLFTIPIILSGLLQLFFNAADVIVVGRFAGSNALSAVASNSALINLIVNLLSGLSVGASVIVAYDYGAENTEQIQESVNTAIIVSIAGGILTGAAGIFISPQLLIWMDMPKEILPLATVYLRIYFLGLPFMSLFNFGSAVLRSLGDSKHPLYYLTIGGILNVILNLILVAIFHLDVAGVAIATAISQAFSALLVLRHLMLPDSPARLSHKDFHISVIKLRQILRIGIPAGIQSTIFSVSNVLIQSSLYSLGAAAVAGCSASANIGGFIYVSMNSFYQSAQTFTSQKVGAKQWSALNHILLTCSVMAGTIGLLLGSILYFFGEELLSIYIPDNIEAIRCGLVNIAIVMRFYALCGIMDVFSGMVRGMGASLLPMLVTIFGSCVFRIIWIYTIFPKNPGIFSLYLSYPISWAITGGIHLICYFMVKKKLLKNASAVPGNV